MSCRRSASHPKTHTHTHTHTGYTLHYPQCLRRLPHSAQLALSTETTGLVSTELATVSVFEDDLIVGEEQLRHDVRILPVQPQGALR